MGHSLIDLIDGTDGVITTPFTSGATAVSNESLAGAEGEIWLITAIL